MVIGVCSSRNATQWVVSVTPGCPFGVVRLRAPISGCVVGVGRVVIGIGANFGWATDRVILIFDAIAKGVDFGFNPTVFCIFGTVAGTTGKVAGNGVGIDDFRPVYFPRLGGRGKVTVFEGDGSKQLFDWVSRFVWINGGG